MQPIPYGKQNITDEDVQAVIETLKSDYLTQGPKIGEFENAFAKYTGARFAVAVANGTAALHLCTLALEVRPGQRVITTPITFAATSNCVHYCGGDVVFADITPGDYLIDINAVKNLIESSPRGTYAGIIPVDFAGRAVNLENLKKLANQYGLWIVEDACHAPGGYFVDSAGKQQYCGNGSFADLAIFSLHPVKHIATGEGGVITTNDEKLYKKLLTLRTHGITREPGSFTNGPTFASAGESDDRYPGWYMEMQMLGYNYRLTDFQAALGISQLGRADEGLKKRQKLAERYENAFKNCDFIFGQSGAIKGHAYHLYIIEVKNRLGLYEHLRKNQIYAQIHYVPTHLMPYYRQFGWKEGDMPKAEQYYGRCISLPMFPTLTLEQQDFVIETIINFYKQQ